MKKYTLQKVQGKDEWKCPYCNKTWPTPVADPPTRIPRPLKKEYIEVANAEVTKCPNLESAGSLRKIKWKKGRGDQKDYPCRRRWMDAYLLCIKKQTMPPKKVECVESCCAQKTGTLIVTVFDSKRNPLDNASVYLWDLVREGKTDSKGQVKFTGLAENDRYILRAWKDATEIGIVTYVWPEKTAQSPTVIACKEVNYIVKLDKKYIPGKLQVLVLDNFDNPVKDATVKLKPDPIKPSNYELFKKSDRKTEPAGLAYYSNLRIGEYKVKAFHEGCSSKTNTVRIENSDWHKTKLKIDYSNPEKKQFSILIERVSWRGVSSLIGLGVSLLCSAVFKIQDSESGNSARYEIKNAPLGEISFPLPVSRGDSTMEGDPVKFEAQKYYMGRELSVNDFAGIVNVKYGGASIGQISFWDVNFELEFVGLPNPSIKDRYLRIKGTMGWLKAENIKPGRVKSLPGLEGGSMNGIHFVPKTTL